MPFRSAARVSGQRLAANGVADDITEAACERLVARPPLREGEKRRTLPARGVGAIAVKAANNLVSCWAWL